RSLPFVIDTGSSITILKKSFEKDLGERVSTMQISSFKGQLQANIHGAPRLYLGKSKLLTKPYVACLDGLNISSIFHEPGDEEIMGVLRMDCLRHYCIQFDFTANKIRFINPERLYTAELGKRFQIVFSTDDQGMYNRPFIYHPSF